ncbi:hypothetical protein BAY61_05280 [Prauserella marina]|uniref:Uncharacterized protein n=1 Tax=Prauserella marina TaxID=530584 RepID=A0A222VKN6_9PSEU|nr:hypothetical protein [Prauserella marina]ASR34499.1 hypothetical protein BAY61_05280 [Prauserella marina]PWV85902.1 hypothetical protein DES30_1011932 [Prauserella marina]SDC42740.1 hypothetical protein SAMN05421630_10260 [Prauserella marina]
MEEPPRGGIATALRQLDPEQYAEFEELEVDGQKAVVFKAEADDRSCVVLAAMDERTTFAVRTVYERDATGRSQGCSLAVQFAEEFTPSTTT